MREHVFQRHSSAASLAREYGTRFHTVVKKIRRRGMWAYVDVPNAGDGPATVHFWFRDGQDPRDVARLIGHELGHIADGPHDHSPEEEVRADEYGRAAQEALSLLQALGLVAYISHGPDE